MKKNKKYQRAKSTLLSDDYNNKNTNTKINNTLLKAEKRSRESHGKYKSLSDSTS